MDTLGLLRMRNAILWLQVELGEQFADRTVPKSGERHPPESGRTGPLGVADEVGCHVSFMPE